MEMELDRRALILTCCTRVKISSVLEELTLALVELRCPRMKVKLAFNAFRAATIILRYIWVVIIVLTFSSLGCSSEGSMCKMYC